MMFLFLFLILAGVAAGLWFHGTWGNALTLVNIILAGLIATNFFEPLSDFLQEQAPAPAYLFDFAVLWALFIAAFALFRGLTDSFGENWIPLQFPVETACRTVLAIICGWVMVCFTAFSLHMAPLNAENPLGAWSTPMESTFLGMSPDRQWAAFAFSRSRGVFARETFSPTHLAPDDEPLNVQPFDSKGDFLYRYHQRRASFEKLESIAAEQ